MKFNFSFILLAFLCMICPISYATEIPSDLLILTENYSPMNYEENGTLKGISVDLLESALQEIDPAITRESFQVVSWDEGYNTTLNRNNTLLFSTARIPERENIFLWAGPLMNDPKALFGLKSEAQSLQSDISKLRVVVLHSDSSQRYVIDAGALPENLILVSTQKEAIEALENGTADAWAYGKNAGQQYVKLYADNPQSITPFMDIAGYDLYLACNRNTSPELVQEINESLSNLRNNRSETGGSEYERIVSQYLPIM